MTSTVPELEAHELPKPPEEAPPSREHTTMNMDAVRRAEEGRHKKSVKVTTLGARTSRFSLGRFSRIAWRKSSASSPVPPSASAAAIYCSFKGSKVGETVSYTRSTSIFLLSQKLGEIGCRLGSCDWLFTWIDPSNLITDEAAQMADLSAVEEVFQSVEMLF